MLARIGSNSLARYVVCRTQQISRTRFNNADSSLFRELARVSGGLTPLAQSFPREKMNPWREKCMVHTTVDETFRQTNLTNESSDYLAKREELRLAEIELMR